MECLINSIYPATEGEGVLIGTPQIFVRFQGCFLGCANCDSKETWNPREAKSMSVEKVVEEILNVGGGRVFRASITGGDPLNELNRESCLALVKELKNKAFTLNVEASGDHVEEEIFRLVDFISWDFKTPSSGVKTDPDLLLQLIDEFPGKFQVKSVIADDEDFLKVFSVWEWIKKSRGKISFPWCLTPSYCPGESFSPAWFEHVMKLNLDAGGPFRVIGQQHKWIFGPDKRLV